MSQISENLGVTMSHKILLEKCPKWEYMVIMSHKILVFWKKVASALKGFKANLVPLYNRFI